MESRQFIIEYHGNEKECIPDIISLLETKYDTVTKRFGKELKRKTTVKICSDRSE